MSDILDDIIKSSKKILLLSHMNPDGDTLGSMCAMYHMIYNRYKIKADMNVVSNIPFNYKFLPDIDKAERYFDKSLVYDLAISLEVAEHLKKRVINHFRKKYNRFV